MATLPDIIPIATLELDSLGVYQVFKPFDSPEKTLYLMPQNLVVSRDGQGKPRIRVVMVRDCVAPRPGAAGAPATAAWGFMTISAKIGFAEWEPVFAAAKAKIAMFHPEYQDWGITNVELTPGTGELGVEVLGGPAAGEVVGSNRQVWFPYGVATTVGAEVTAQVPLTKEQAEIIRQTLLTGGASSSTLQVKLMYRAESVFALHPCTVSVDASKSEMFSYFHEKISAAGGFWIASWSYQREKLREHYTSSQIIKTKIVMGSPELQPFADKYLNIPELVKRYEDDAVEFLADITVDRTGKVPDNTFEKREGRITIFSPSFYWSYTAWAGGSYGVTDIERHAEGNYHREISLEGQVARQVYMEQKQVNLTAEAFQLVDLNQAAYVADVLSFEAFHTEDKVVKQLYAGGYVQSLRIVAVARGPSGDQTLTFVSNADRPDAQSSVFWRDATATVDHGQLRFSLPAIRIQKASLDCGAFKLEAPARDFERTSDRFMANVLLATDFFGYVRLRADVWFKRPGNQDKMLSVRVTRPETSEPQIFLLTPGEPNAWVMYEETHGLTQAKMSIRLEDGLQEYQWGPERNLSAAQADVLIVDTLVGRKPVA
jgi:hypothetical protein